MIPKFRVFDSKFKEMEEVYLMDWQWPEQDAWINDNPSDDLIFMQSTGLHDKNGIEIFEGDIVEHLDFNSNEISKSEVRIVKGCFYLVISVDGFKYDVPMMDLKEDECILEIKGNVHENPELLEEQK